MSTTLFLVSTGEYSNYCIRGIFSTIEKAEYAKKLWQSANDIDEMILDELPEHPLNTLRFLVYMEKDGTANVESMPPIIPDYEESHFGDGELRMCVWARDKEHAIKIVNEKRAQLIAMGKWVDKGYVTLDL